MNRRPVPLALALGLVAVLVGLGFGLAYVFTSQPLEFGSSAALPSTAENVDDPDLPTYDVTFVEHGPVRWGIEVRNRLPVPVAIRGVRQWPEGFALLTTNVQLHLVPGDTIGADPSVLLPFSRVELAPGGAVFLAVSEEFVECPLAHRSHDPGTGLGRVTLPLDITILGMDTTTDVPLPFTVMYQAPTSADC